MSEQAYRQAAEEFIQLTLENKKKKLLDLIAAFDNAHPIFWQLTEDIKAYKYTDNQYSSIYKIILKSMYEVDQKWLAVGVTKIQELHHFLMELRAKEAEGIKQEGDIDEWLNKVLSTLQ